MRVILVIVFAVLSLGAYGQKKKPAMVKDTYKGVLSSGNRDVELVLKHERHAGMGTFELKEKGVVAGDPNGWVVSKGEWTHHRGIPGNENATAIELYYPRRRDAQSTYYLVLKNGDIRLLDKDLKMIKSEGNYVLKKQK